MAKLTLGTETFDVPALSLGDLELAAPHIEAVNSAVGATSSWSDIAHNFRNILSVAVISLHSADDLDDGKVALAAGEFLRKATMKDATSIWKFFTEIMIESGMISADPDAGELQAGASTTLSPQTDAAQTESPSDLS